MENTWACLLPFLIVIPVAMWTKQVQSGLFVGLLLGSFLMYPNLLGAPEHLIHYLISNMIVKNNIRIVIFLYVFAGLVGMIKYTGGIKGFVHLISKKVKTKRSAMLLTWFSTLGTFSEPDFRIVTVAPIMKALSERLKMPKKRVALAISFTANPVIALIPVATAFVGYMVSVIGQAMDAAGVHGSPYVIYVKSIPFNFFSFIIILVGIYYSFLKKEKKGEGVQIEGSERETESMEKGNHRDEEGKGLVSGPYPQSSRSFQTEMGEENRTDMHGDTAGMYEKNRALLQENKDLAKQDQGEQPPHADQQEDLGTSHRAYQKSTPIRPWNLIIPISFFLMLTLFLSWWDGHSQAKSFFGAFIKSDMLGVMLTSLLSAVIVALGFFITQKFSASKLVTHFIKGGNELMNVIVMLTLIWALTAVSEDLGFSHYITAHVQGWIPPMFVAPILFILGAVISYFIGSSWGTWGLLMPLGVTLAVHSHASLLLVIGAVFSSGTFGAFASPLSDNTVTLSTIMDMKAVKYSRTKLVPASIAAGISVICFGAASFIL